MTNINQVGIESIRIDDKEIKDLPIAEQAMALSQMGEVRKIDKQNKKNIIISKYPKISKKYLESRIKEAKENIERISTASTLMLKQSRDYEVLINQCQIRDERIDNLKEDKFKKEKIKKMFKELPPYSVDAMKQQIVQWYEGMDRCNEVVKKEYLSIAELTSTLGLCNLRDIELRSI